MVKCTIKTVLVLEPVAFIPINIRKPKAGAMSAVWHVYCPMFWQLDGRIVPVRLIRCYV